MEFGFGIGLAAVLVFVAVFFGLRQRTTLAQVRRDPEMTADDRAYYLKQARRRLLCSVLLIVVAGLLVGWFFVDDVSMRELPPGQEPSQEDKDAARFIALYWIVLLCVLMGILLLASFDLIATARFGMRRVRQLEQERRAALEMEAARLRRRRQELN